MKLIKIPIALSFLLSLTHCAGTRTLEFENFRHPIFLSKVRYPGDKGGEENLVSSTTLKNYHKNDEYFISSGQNLSTETKKSVRGVPKPYMKSKKLSVEAHSYWFGSHSSSSSLLLEVDVASMEKEGKVNP